MKRHYSFFRVFSALLLLSTAARSQTQGDPRELMRELAEKYEHPSSYYYDFVTVTNTQTEAFRSKTDMTVEQAKGVQGPYAEGLQQLKQSQYERAVELLSQVGEGDRDYTNARYYIGLSYSRLQRYPEAAKAFRQVIDLDPTNLFAHYELAKALFKFDKKTAEQEQQFLRDKSPDLLLYLNEDTGDSVPGSEGDSLPAGGAIYEANRDGATKPTILYKEKANYTEIARRNYVQGTVVLTAVFTKGGEITGIRVIRALPDGLTYQAIEAVRRIRFAPATKDGQPVDTRANLEFTFNLF